MKVILHAGYYVKDYENGKKTSVNGDYLQDSAVQAWIAEGNTPDVYQEPEPTYIELRQAEYPSLAEQLDMQYWDSVNGTTVWADTIQSIKDKYPKPMDI
ncbi:MAG: hypothetical protein C0603_05605 [Denitrovibrio sp.]|nr:MAG: hypothetical protein C0603_05605 [Denitrovibrio sp.]